MITDPKSLGRWRRSRTAPPGRLADDDVAAADARLLRSLDHDFRRAAAAAGDLLACRAGCAECCHGPFPITPLDVWRLARGMEALAMADSERHAAVEARARDAVAILRPDFPGDPASGRLAVGEDALDEYFERHAALACPALDPESLRCDVYAWRPVSCRTYGPPARFGDEATPPCRLCFVEASAGEIERCRMEPDREGLEETILSGMGVPAGDDWETPIAHALACRSRGDEEDRGR